jgi:DNA polymerase-3 subunit gamma/tau
MSDLTAQVKDATIETLLDYLNFMAGGDEEVARSANPRFSLEAVLVRLATLPKTLPVVELIERLETLEGKLSGARAVAPPVKAQPVMAPLTPQPVKSPPGSGGDKAEVWRDFVAFVNTQKKFLGSHLQSGVALELSPGQLKIGITERHHLNYLQDAENLLVLKSLAKQFFADDLAISLAVIDGDSLPPGATAPGATLPRSEEKSEMVKEALRVFGGAVKTVRRENG